MAIFTAFNKGKDTGSFGRLKKRGALMGIELIDTETFTRASFTE